VGEHLQSTPGHRSPSLQAPGEINSLFKFPQASKTLDHWGNPLGNPLKFTHSSTFSLKLLPLRNFPQSIHPLFNFPSQMEVPKATHPLFNFSIIRWSQQAGRAGKRQESPSPVEELVQSFPKSTLAFSKPAPIARTNSLSSLTLQLSRPVQ
jgi:hypothetical protein